MSLVFKMRDEILQRLEGEFNKTIEAGASCCEIACRLYQLNKAPHEIVANRQWINAHEQAHSSLRRTISIMRRYLLSIKDEPVQIYNLELGERIKGAWVGCRQCKRGLEMLSGECIASKILDGGNKQSKSYL